MVCMPGDCSNPSHWYPNNPSGTCTEAFLKQARDINGSSNLSSSPSPFLSLAGNFIPPLPEVDDEKIAKPQPTSPPSNRIIVGPDSMPPLSASPTRQRAAPAKSSRNHLVPASPHPAQLAPIPAPTARTTAVDRTATVTVDRATPVARIAGTARTTAGPRTTPAARASAVTARPTAVAPVTALDRPAGAAATHITAVSRPATVARPAAVARSTAFARPALVSQATSRPSHSRIPSGRSRQERENINSREDGVAPAVVVPTRRRMHSGDSTRRGVASSRTVRPALSNIPPNVVAGAPPPVRNVAPPAVAGTKRKRPDVLADILTGVMLEPWRAKLDELFSRTELAVLPPVHMEEYSRTLAHVERIAYTVTYNDYKHSRIGMTITALSFMDDIPHFDRYKLKSRAADLVDVWHVRFRKLKVSKN